MAGGSSRRYPPELRERAVRMVAEVRVQPHLAHFRPRRHLLSANGWRHEMADRFTVWNEITGVTTTAV